MPPPPTLKITEIFSSIQGEGLRQGEPTLFIRLTGCNLQCDFCDTQYAWLEGEEMSMEDILEKVEGVREDFPSQWVCLTGGEPLFQDIKKLVEELKKKEYKIQVETNGTIYQNLDVDWYSVSPKPPDYFFQPEYPKKAKEVKLVVSKELNLDVIQRIRNEFPDTIPVLLQPESNQKWSKEKGERLLRKSAHQGLKNIKVTLQLHKVYGIP
ncbi:7-carboxy-7-deazaguanine synthase QueE [bacterium]|nr:7-carboxy-7-deazaguanine synthase QueE [bacterium]